MKRRIAQTATRFTVPIGSCADQIDFEEGIRYAGCSTPTFYRGDTQFKKTFGRRSDSDYTLVWHFRASSLSQTLKKPRMMNVARTLAYCLFALGASTFLASTSAELRQNSGSPESTSCTVGAETVRRLTPSAEQLRKRFGIADSGSDLPDIFVLGRNLKLSVKYGSDRLACSIAVETVDIANPYLPKEEVSKLLDEFAPPAMRGKVSAGGEFCSSCLGVGMAAYENVFIGRWPNYCAPEHPNTEKRATLQFKRDACPNPYVEKKPEPVISR